MNTIERIVDLIEKKGILEIQFLRDLKLNKNRLSEWKNGKTTSWKDHIVEIADYFGVSTDYLLTGKEPLSKELPADQQELLSLWEQLNYEKKIEFKGELKGYIRAKAEDTTKKGIGNAEFVEKGRGDAEIFEEVRYKRA